jgi:hypothetical protein
MKKKILISLVIFLYSINLFSQPKLKEIPHVIGYRMEETHLGPLSERDKNGNILFYSATDKAIIQYETNDSINVYDILKKALIVNAFHKDQQGCIWYSQPFNKTKKYDGTTITEIPIVAKMFFEDSKGNIFINATNKMGSKSELYIYNNTKGLVKISTIEDLTMGNNFIRCFYEDNNGNVWVGVGNPTAKKMMAAGAIYKYSTGVFTCIRKTNYSINRIFGDSKGSIWFCGGLYTGNNPGEILKYRDNSFTNFELDIFGVTEKLSFIETVNEDGNGNIWFGMKGKGGWSNGLIVKYDGVGVETFDKEKLGLKELNICCCLVNSDNNIIYGLANGIFIINNNNGYEFFDKKNSILKNDAILNILEDKAGNLLFFTNFSTIKMKK